MSVALWAASAIMGTAQTLPQGGTVASGQATVTQPGAGTMVIQQGSQNAIVNWDSFSIGQGGHVDIQQPNANASMLNRVTGGTTSQIHGHLSANGNVHLVNPNGIFIGANGTVNAGGFVASTLDISDGDFNAGRLQYRGLGNSANVENAGRITIGRGGYAALLGGKVKNSGTVVVPYGRIGFAAGEQVVLDVSGDQFLQVAVPSNGEDDGEALIENSGTASAEGGLIEMRAATARNAARHAINLSGVAEASSVAVRGGTIVLGGGAGGLVTVSGRATTRAAPAGIIVDQSKRPPVKGGNIDITGARIALNGADIDASGDGSGGLIRIGGDFAGQGDLPRAETLSTDAATLIKADGLDNSDGGRIVLWSDVQTDFDGNISARGGDLGGNGGFVEVSSKLTLNYAGLADLRAPNGVWGSLLLDPTDFTINAGAGANNEDVIENQLNFAGDFTLNTASAGFDPGNIVVNATLDWTTTSTLTLIADTGVQVFGGFNAPSGTLRLDGDSVVSLALGSTVDVQTLFVDSSSVFAIGGSVTERGGGGAVNVGEFLLSGDWTQNNATLSTITTTNFDVVSNGIGFTRVTGGDGSLGNPFQIVDVFGLQGIGTSALLGQNFVLMNDINTSVANSWTAGNSDGFVMIPTLDGTLDGNHFAIQNLDMFRDDGEGGIENIAFIESIEFNGSVVDLDITNATMTGRQGAILALFNDGVIDAVRVDGTLNVTNDAGGIVMTNRTDGEISDSTADVAITLTIPDTAIDFQTYGGFVGENSGTIDRSTAFGDISITNNDQDQRVVVGGFVGLEESGGETINDSIAHGNITVVSTFGTDSIVEGGGFVGRTNGAINRSFSTGSVTASGPSTDFLGGFAGVDIGGSDSGNFWDTTTSGLMSSAVGTGLSTAQFQDTETFLALGTAQGWDFADIWAPGDTGFYPANYATTPVIFAQPAGFEDIQYGLTTSAVASGTISGGVAAYQLFEDGDTLDTSGVFSALTFADQNVGNTTFRPNSANITAAGGLVYRVVDREAGATISPAPLTLTANDQTKTYGDLLSFAGTEFSVTSGQLFFSDAVTSVGLSSAGAQADAVVTNPDSETGAYPIMMSRPTGTGLSNYTISLNGGDLTVNRAPLTITANDVTKAQGDILTFNGTEFTVSGLRVSGDSVDNAAISSTGAGEDAAQSGSPFPILIGDAMGTRLENYDITYVNGQLVISDDTTSVPIPPVFIGFPLPNPGDTTDLGGNDTDTASFSADTAAADATQDEVEDAAESLEAKAESCGQGSGDVGRYLACLSDSLNEFADELDALSADLPPGMQNVAQIVQDARVKVDAASRRAASRLAGATTDAQRQAIRADAVNEARSALAEASTEIRKAITLVRAEDPELASVQRATITRVADAVDTVGISLSRQVEL